MSWWQIAASAAADIGSSLLSNYYQRSENKKAFNRNVAMWNMENEYNHPVQQMARLREAGLNPNMVYGSGATTLAASTKTAQPANVSFPQLDALQMMNAYQDLKQKDAMTENLKAQNNLIWQQAASEAKRGKMLDYEQQMKKKEAKDYLDAGIRPTDDYKLRIGKTWYDSLPEGDRRSSLVDSEVYRR